MTEPHDRKVKAVINDTSGLLHKGPGAFLLSSIDCLCSAALHDMAFSQVGRLYLDLRHSH